MAWAARVGRVYARHLDFAGRSGRVEFWTWVGFQSACLLAILALGVLAGALGESVGEVVALGAIWSVVHLLPSLALTLRRLHDRDLSGLWVGIVILPLFGWIILLVLCLWAGTRGPNRFGPDPTLGASAF